MILRKNKRISCVIPLVLSTMVIFSACSNKKQEEPMTKTEVVLGTVCTIKIYDHATESTMNKVFERLKNIEDKMSINKDKSEVIDINNAAGVDYVKVSDDTYDVIKRGKYFSELYGDKFDITIGPIVKLWNIGFDNARVPEDSEIKAKLPLINYKNVLLNDAEKKVMLKEKGMMIDLGGIAKGYAADEAAKVLKANGVEHAIINLGGNVLTVGSRLDGKSWVVGVQNPTHQRGDYIGTVKVDGKTVVTSGIYERYFEKDGKVYHHILDTATGYPVDNNLYSVTIITDVSMDADGLAKIFCMGLDKGMDFVKNLKGVNAIFVTKNSEVYITPGLKDNFQLTDSNFKLAN